MRKPSPLYHYGSFRPNPNRPPIAWAKGGGGGPELDERAETQVRPRSPHLQIAMLSSHHGRRIQQSDSLRRLFAYLASNFFDSSMLLYPGSHGSDLAVAFAAHWNLAVQWIHSPQALSLPPHRHNLGLRTRVTRDQALPSGNMKTPQQESSDIVLTRQADLIIPCWVRLGGRIETLIDQCLTDRHRRVSIAVPDCPRLIPPGCLRRWKVPRIKIPPPRPPSQNARAEKRLPPPLAIEPREFTNGDQWLIHATRASDRRRPGETRADFFKRWLNTPVAHWGDAFAALLSILRQRFIHTSRLQGPGGLQYTSLSRLPIAKLAGSRVYRRGRQHWDYEPFGIAFQPRVLHQMVAQPVHYETTTGQPHPAQSKWQPNPSPPASRARLPERWSHEQEWLIRGPIDLASLDTADWLPFVPHENYARQLAGLGLQRFAVVPISSPPGTPRRY
jgi:hypothetical protein